MHLLGSETACINTVDLFRKQQDANNASSSKKKKGNRRPLRRERLRLDTLAPPERCPWPLQTFNKSLSKSGILFLSNHGRCLQSVVRNGGLVIEISNHPLAHSHSFFSSLVSIYLQMGRFPVAER
jgi:hypothetical protein